jgi:phage repressor protein C with HTH and peptisase S24 domain
LRTAKAFGQFFLIASPRHAEAEGFVASECIVHDLKNIGKPISVKRNLITIAVFYRLSELMPQNQRVTPSRLKEAMRDAGYKTQRSLAERLGISQGAVSEMLSGRTQNTRHLARLADLLGVSIAWLLGTSDSKTPEREEGFYEGVARDMDAVLIQETDIRYGMGGGGFGDAALQGTPVAFPREWLRPLIKKDFDQLFIAHATGDSMSPTLADGDVVIVDRAQNRLRDQDSIWCIALGDLCMIKRVRMLPDGGYQINSDNPSVAPLTAYDGELHVIGRVIWSGRRM